MKKYLKYLSLVLVVVMLATALSACKKEEKETTQYGLSDVAVNELANTVEDSSDLPEWEGKKLELRMWYGAGTGSLNRNNEATNDVVIPEIFRVTGVKFTEDSFDNGGELMDAKIGKIIAGNNWPDIVMNPEKAVLDKMIAEDMVYDLTELITKYCPNLMAMNEIDKENPILKSNRKDGKLYTIFSQVPIDYLCPDLEPALLARVKKPVDPIGYVYVRDDVLKMLYPKAKSQDEIEALYMKNGKFTKEEILDITFKTKDDFFDFLYDIKKLKIKENGREVFPTYAFDGIDNWSLLTVMGFLYGHPSTVNYFTYWDKETDRVEYMFKQPFFKEILKDWTKLVQDEIASPDSLIDKRSVFEEKISNGQYAVLYGQALPEQNVLNASNKAFRYRKVYIDIPIKDEKFVFNQTRSGPNNFAILKKNVEEEDLPQILRFFDFMVSETGQKLAYWGPRSAGLFTEENGIRKFVDKELENEVVYDEAGENKQYYNLEAQAWPLYPMCESIHQPKLVYDLEKKASLANKYFAMGTVEIPKRVETQAPQIWTFDAYGVKGATSFWLARQSFEDAIIKILISKNEKEFNKHYNAMVKLAERNGLTDETLKEMNEVFKVINEKYMDNLE